MKDTSQWQRQLAHKLSGQKDQLAEANLSIRQFLEIELGLFLAASLLPHTSPGMAVPALLSGHRYPFSEEPTWTVAQQQYRHRARFLIGSFRHSSVWNELLAKYHNVPERLRGYTFSGDPGLTIQQAVSVCPERFDLYETALANVLPLRTQSVEWAETGESYVAEAALKRLHVTLPQQLPSTTIIAHQLRTTHSRMPLSISLIELVDTARWMDAEAVRRGLREHSDWTGRVGRLRIDTYQTAIQQFVRDKHLTLDGATHVVGMLSAGKSTLMDVLAVWAVRQGYRITLLVNDVSDVLKRCNYFHLLGLPVAPMLGKSSREQHLTRLHAMTTDEASLLDTTQPTHRGFHWLSTACSLPAISTEATSFDVNNHPCLSLTDTENKKYACPLYGGCAYHNAQRELVEARIRIGTPASLLYTRADRQLTTSATQFAELIYKNSDIVVIDEADRVQVQFDLAFSPGQTLANDYCNGWLDLLVKHVREVQAKAGRGIRAKTLAAPFRRIMDTANVACEKLYDLLMDEEPLRKWVHGRQYFTGWLLFDHIADQLIENRSETDSAVHPPLPPIFESFLKGRDPLGEDADHALSVFAGEFMVQDLNRVRLRQRLTDWLTHPDQKSIFTKPVSENGLSIIVLKMEFALLLAVLENRLSHLIRNWNQVESVFELSEWGQNLFVDPPKEYLSMIPMSPAGNVLAFRYEGNDNGGAGKLAFFKNLGIGRQFLLNFHRLYEADDVPGPHVLLLSGTSWAGSSPSYHLQLPVAALLRSSDLELAGINQSEFAFWPVLNSQKIPIKVSGLRNEYERHRALEHLVRGLVKTDAGSGRSQLESNWNHLPAGRQGALFVVGSYREAKVVRDQIVKVRPEWGEQVVALIPDSESYQENQVDAQQSIQRGKVHEFAQRNGLILIAPLMAIERGHNILNDLGVAALGTAYFLVRPHPHPDDIGLAVKAINRWALDHYDRPGWYAKQIGHWPAGADELHRCFRREAVKRWNSLMRMPIRFSTMPDEDREAFYWDQLVSIWQVIGRLIRGGVPAKVYFCDAAFAQQSASDQKDTARTSLLVGLIDILRPFFDPHSDVRAEDRAIAEALYKPFFQALTSIQGLHYDRQPIQHVTPDGV